MFLKIIFHSSKILLGPSHTYLVYPFSQKRSWVSLSSDPDPGPSTKMTLGIPCPQPQVHVRFQKNGPGYSIIPCPFPQKRSWVFHNSMSWSIFTGSVVVLFSIYPDTIHDLVVVKFNIYPHFYFWVFCSSKSEGHGGILIPQKLSWVFLFHVLVHHPFPQRRSWVFYFQIPGIP